jgi:hypothetical protein
MLTGQLLSQSPLVLPISISMTTDNGKGGMEGSMDQLKKSAELKEQGMLTEDEFNEAKKRILDKLGES